jgi:hypothetical protein
MAYHNATRTIVFKGVDQSNHEEEVAWLVLLLLIPTIRPIPFACAVFL